MRNLLLRIGKLFSNPNQSIRKSVAAQCLAHIPRSLVGTGQHKHLAEFLDGSRNVVFSSVDTDYLEVIPRGLNLCAEILQGADTAD